MTEEEYYQQMWNESRHGCGGLTAALFIIIAMLALLTGCRTQYVPVETVIKEYIHSTDTVREKDTIRNEKETIIREAGAADSAMLAKLGLQIKNNERIILVLKNELERQSHEKQEMRTDTIIREKEVQIPYPVERKLSRFEQFKMDYGAISFGVSIAAVIAAVVFIILWLRRKSKL